MVGSTWRAAGLREMLRIARGVALEYLDTVLPARLRLVLTFTTRSLARGLPASNDGLIWRRHG